MIDPHAVAERIISAHFCSALHVEIAAAVAAAYEQGRKDAATDAKSASVQPEPPVCECRESLEKISDEILDATQAGVPSLDAYWRMQDVARAALGRCEEGNQ